MKIGVKIGPANWKHVLGEITPSCVEVWFRLGAESESAPIFEELNKKQIPFGIHFWGVLKEGYEPNLAFGPDCIAEKSAVLVRETIDIAAACHASYVNVHPGSLTLRTIDLDNKSMQVLHDRMVTEKQAMDSLIAQTAALDTYAKSRQILFLIETLPACELEHWRDDTGRVHVQEAGNITALMIYEIARKTGVAVTNDFGHTIASWVSDDRDYLFNQLKSVTAKLAPYTRLIHLNTVRPPFNGTDSHDGVLPEDFSAGVLPTREQVRELLSLFKNRDDVWIIPEPSIDTMVANYHEIHQIVKELRF